MADARSSDKDGRGSTIRVDGPTWRRLREHVHGYAGDPMGTPGRVVKMLLDWYDLSKPRADISTPHVVYSDASGASGEATLMLPEPAPAAESKWTPEQMENAYRFGICRICGCPRELVGRRSDGTVVQPDEPGCYSMGICCPNGHSAADPQPHAHEVHTHGCFPRGCCSSFTCQHHDASCERARIAPVPAPADDSFEATSNAYARILAATFGEDAVLSPDLLETPRRAADAWQELTSGYWVPVAELFKTFDAEGYDEMIAVVGVPFTSLCEHHLLPFVGHAHVVYLPNERLVGLSKIPRLVNAFARRLQQQERLTTDIADALVEHLQPLGVLVVCEAHHSCLSARGVRSPGTMRTSVTRGAMRDKPETRAEAFALIDRNGGST